MIHRLRWRLFAIVCFFLIRPFAFSAEPGRVDMAADTLRDKIRGGLLGQMLGNLNGLKHEMKYIDEPGGVTNYTPALPEGAWTDDDTDFEWVYIVEMQRQNQLLLSPTAIAKLWRERINRRIWCSNQFARQLMDLGLEPPLTGNSRLNPWAEFNISGQFLCETFGLLAPGMPQTAARIGLDYTTVAIDGEPAQTTQLFTAMIATAFVTEDLDAVIDSGLGSIDPHSQLRGIIADVRRWRGEHPADWRAMRKLLKEKYSRYGGAMRDKNGYELNTATTIAALLYGNGDFAATLQYAFNFGWDCDNSAATAGTIVGVMRGYRTMMSQGWQIVDRYRNTTRDEMPMDETITGFADRVIDLAGKNIVEHGGSRRLDGSRAIFSLPVESTACVRPLEDSDLVRKLAGLKSEMISQFRSADFEQIDEPALARAAYLAICLDLAPELKERDSQRWQRAVNALAAHENVVQAIYFQADVPAGAALREKAAAAGLVRPRKAKPLW